MNRRGATERATPDINRILRERPRSSLYGSPMGALNRDDRTERGQFVYCQRVRFIDGDYAPDGTYWGGGRGTLPLYCIFTADLALCWYVRARDRAEAMRAYRQEANERAQGGTRK
jgi:hypothetical protein